MEPIRPNQEVLDDLTKKDKRFRVARMFFFVVLAASVIGIVVIQAYTLGTVKEQLRTANATADAAKRTTNQVKTSSDTVNRHLDCIVAFFQRPDRASITIEDINKCTLSKQGDITQSFPQPPSSGGDASNASGNGQGSANRIVAVPAKPSVASGSKPATSTGSGTPNQGSTGSSGSSGGRPAPPQPPEAMSPVHLCVTEQYILGVGVAIGCNDTGLLKLKL